MSSPTLVSEGSGDMGAWLQEELLDLRDHKRRQIDPTQVARGESLDRRYQRPQSNSEGPLDGLGLPEA